MLHTLWPRGEGRTDVVCEWFFEPETMALEGFDPSDAVALLGPGQPRGLAGVRAHPARDGHDAATPRPLHDAGGRRAPLRRDGGRPLRRGAGDRRGHVMSGFGGGNGNGNGNGHSAANGNGNGFDAIVVGGGHNGLTAAAYLARAGLRVVRARAPRHPRRRVRDRGAVARPARRARLLRRLHAPAEGRRRPAAASDFGYDPIPLDPPFGTFAADGSAILFPTTRRRRTSQIARVSPQGRRRDAEASRRCWSAPPASCGR